MSRPGRVRPRRFSILFLVVATSLATGPGCANGLLAQWRESSDLMSQTDPEGSSRTLLGRLAHFRDTPKSTALKDDSSLVSGSNGLLRPPDPTVNKAAEAEFRAIQTLYEQGKFEEAEKAFEILAKKHKGDSVGEKTLYFLAETQFQRGHYVAAHDTIDRLYTDHPSSAYLNKALVREYQIGILWLSVAQPEMQHPGLDTESNPFQPGFRASSNPDEVAKAKTDAEAKLKKDKDNNKNTVKVATDKVEPPLPFNSRFDGGLPAIDVAGWAEKASNTWPRATSPARSSIVP